MAELKSKVKNFETKSFLKKKWAELALIPLFVLALSIRMLPSRDMEYLQALDSYLILRQSQQYAYTGTFPILDFSRYFPFSTPSHADHQGVVIIPAIMYWLGPFLVFENYLAFAQAYPAIIGAISVVVMYFLGKELFDKITGLCSAFFLATIAGVMHRSSAGFFQKDPLGMLLMLFSLYFFTKAWKKESWGYGVLSGVALGLFTTVWGGASINWMLYAAFAGLILFFNTNTHRLLVSYTPTIIVGSAVGMSIQPGSLWFDDIDFLGNFAILIVLWLRYLVGELGLIKKDQLDYFVPSLYVLGGISALLSPLYSNFIAQEVFGLVGRITRESGSVIGGTVAESTPMSLQELSTELGAVMASEVSPVLGALANIIGTWPLAFIGTAILTTSVILTVLNKYDWIEDEITSYKLIQIFTVVFIIWTIVFSALFESPIFAVLPALLLAIGSGLFYYLFGSVEEEINIKDNWIVLIPLIWVIASILAATQESRIVFPASYPVALVAGLTLSKGLQKIPELDFSELEDTINPKIVQGVIIGVILIAVIAVNTASGYTAVSGIGESPNEFWFESLETIEEETEPGSVLMSWWDYGYWFISIGERPNIADGGNLGYYTHEGGERMPHNIAEYFIEDDPYNKTEILEKHSVDYLILDQTMIGKYSAVSQIGLGSNEDYQTMTQTYSPGGLQDSIQEGPGGSSLVTMDQFGQLTMYTPISTEEEDGQITNIEVGGQPTIETMQGRQTVNCLMSENGVEHINEDEELGELCIAEDPFYSLERGLATNAQTSMVLVPREIAENNINRLYLMDGYGMDYVEEYSEASNDYVKVWSIDQEQIGE